MLERKCWELEMNMQKKDVWKCTNKKRKRSKGIYNQSKKEVNEQFRKRNQDMNGMEIVLEGSE